MISEAWSDEAFYESGRYKVKAATPRNYVKDIRTESNAAAHREVKRESSLGGMQSYQM